MRNDKEKRQHAAFMRERYRTRNQMQCVMYQQILRLAFPAQMAAVAMSANIKYRLKHADKIRAAKRKHYRKNPLRAFMYCRNRQALIKGATCENPKAVQKVYARAKELRQWFDVVVDHIIPLAKGGRHAADNLQIIYRLENYKKSARLDFSPSVVFV